MFGTRTRFLLATVTLAFGATVASASTVSWDGQTWDTTFGSAAVNGSNLDITATTLSSSDGNYYGDAHYNTDVAFRSASTPYIQATFQDPGGSGSGGYLAFEQESGVGRSWAEIGVDPDNDTTGANYSLFWWNEATNATGEVTIAPRTPGDHVFEIGRRADGTVDFYLDGSLALSTTAITPAFFGDVYLFSVSPTSGAVATFTSFVSGTNYTPVPLPSSAAGGVLLIGGLFATQKFRRRQPLA